MTADEAAWTLHEQETETAERALRGDNGPDEVGPDSALSPALVRAHRLITDPLYSMIPVARWAQTLCDLEPFQRLAGVSLSDVPGEILFQRSFPSRLTHSLGVYHLARLARPRDRALQAAALAHDLGHGPFSHLAEPLMLEQLGIDHEARSAAQLRRAVEGLSGQSARLLAWLDVDEIASLMLGRGPDGRGLLLNGSIDYDNADNVARFALASGLTAPGYDPRALVRGLRLVYTQETPPAQVRVALDDDARAEALAWQADRAVVYRFLQSDPTNVAAHGMLRKAIDLAARAGLLKEAFFEETDAGALAILGSAAVSQPLIESVLRRESYRVIWEAVVPPGAETLPALFVHWRERLELEERLAAEAGLRPHEVVTAFVISRVERAAPMTLTDLATGTYAPTALDAERYIQMLVPGHVGRDYIRRARMAAERTFGDMGVVPLGWPELY